MFSQNLLNLKFTLIPSHIIFEETRMDWFDNLDQRDKDKVTQLLSQGIQHYNGLHQNVLMDMKTKFGLIPAQTQQLYRFLYSKENVMASIILTLSYLKKILILFF